MRLISRLLKRWRERTTHLTVRGRVFVALSIVLLLASYSIGKRQLLLIACLLAGVSIAAAIQVWTHATTLKVARTFLPSPVSAGKTTTVLFRILTRGQVKTIPPTAQDILPWAPWTSPQTGHSYELNPPRRGIFPIGPLIVTFNDPFGLVGSRLEIGGVENITVTPRVVELPEARIWMEAPDGNARLVHPTSTGNDDDLMTREYRRGDALRRVHWHASARHGQLMVRQEEQRAYPEVRLILDTTRSGYSGVKSTQGGGQFSWSHPESLEFDWAVDMTASIGMHLHQNGFLVHVLETGRHQITDPGIAASRANRSHEFLDSLATVRLVDDRPGNLSGKARDGARRGEEARGPAFAIVSHPNEETLNWLTTIRRHSELGFAFVVGGSFSVVSSLETAGWQVEQVSADADLLPAWTRLVERLGVAGVAS